jgi:bifunctional N-acetylglucosamine-1-phosphate-uridyltransferase/glucosamine-1-phosphate-acetyltransferase GlmU-like protein
MIHHLNAIILAAGRGSRLGLKNVPKPMAKISNDKTAIELLIDVIEKTNIDKTVVVTKHKEEILIEYLKRIKPEVTTTTQTVLNGTLEATLVGLQSFDKKAPRDVVVFPGDNGALLTTSTINALIKVHKNEDSYITVLLTNDYNAGTHKIYFKTKDNLVDEQIISAGNIDYGENTHFNTGIICLNRLFLLEYAHDIKPLPNGELTLSRLIEIALIKKIPVFYVIAKPLEVSSINKPEDLDFVKKIAQKSTFINGT